MAQRERAHGAQQLQHIKHWREAPNDAHPVERRAWEAILTIWMIGWLPGFAFESSWAYPLCLLGVMAPRLYAYGVHRRTRHSVSGATGWT